MLLPIRPLFFFGIALLLLGAGSVAQAQDATPNETPSYRKEFTYGINFNTRGGLIGGVNVRSTRVLNDKWSRFWSIEGVEVKHPKEQRIGNQFTGGTYVLNKSNYMFVLRPSFGAQRVIFRKAPESGVQVNALLGGGPSVGLLMPYNIYYDYTERVGGRPGGPEDIRTEQFDPAIHGDSQFIVDKAPLFSGANNVKPTAGVHMRGALSFEYGRYRDAVAGIETGFLFEYFPSRPTILRATGISDAKLNETFFPSVYLTIYLGTRN
ncbi:hypothetical protein [Hymenobacter qilianensis]|uniref:Outer membrane beta-barrel protein n=1 Tax=Hymenobacter qilianensis TaxID=1385715 RepID=A0A7H0GZ92_9BACT|nr:hypothetical protein [Hymenobacter qilianensis]QNP53608.1 hypothetical protein H9L05_08665 [Hymenobacter qilianensis]